MELHLTTATDNSVSHVQIITWNQTFWTKYITSEQSAQLIVLNGFNDALERRQDYQKQLDVLVSREIGGNGGVCDRSNGEVAY